jgi:Concanavalin A-like lectin/glucanases superfamily/Bacterial Ig domain
MPFPNPFSFCGEPPIESIHLEQRGVASHSASRSEFSKPNRTGEVLTAIIVFLLGLSLPAFSQSGSPGLVAAYSFDEGSGNSAADLSGNNINGTVVGATWVPGGMYGNALAFNGTSSYVNLGNSTALQLTGSMTIEAWVKATGNPADDGQIVAKSDPCGWQLKTSPDTGPHTFGVSVSRTPTAKAQRYSTTIRALNTWYHVAGVYDSASQTLSTYLNGSLDNGTLHGTVSASQFNQDVNVNIGRRAGGYYFNGVIDEVRIYNRALSQAEIQTDMATPINGASLPDTTPPTVSIAAPANGAAVAGIAAVSASASDDVGVAGVQFMLDHANLGNEVVSAPYSQQWNTRTANAGNHSLAAVARDFVGNKTVSPAVSVVVSTANPGGKIGFVQVKATTPQSASASVAVSYPLVQTAGNLNIVAVGWNDTTSTVNSVKDSLGNSYALAIGPTTGTGLRQSIYYARNIAGGSNTVTVTFNRAAAFVDVRVLEYSGLDTSSPLDVTAEGTGRATSPSSKSATTTAANELIFGAGMTDARFTGSGGGFTSRIITTPDADIAEDKIVSSVGNYSAAAPAPSSKWVMQMATFRIASGVVVGIAPSIVTQPSDQTVNAGNNATFSVSTNGSTPFSYSWERNQVAVAGANSASYVTPAAVLADSGAKFRVVVSNATGSATSTEAILSVNAVTSSLQDVVTYHNDNARTGQNLNETILTTTNVNSSTFGKIRSLAVDGKVDAEPLYLAGVQNIAGGTHNVLYVATEHDSVYAFDADSGTRLWKVSTLGSGETASDTRGCSQIAPEIGITATPVIDRGSGPHGVIYVVSMSKNSSGNYFQRLHALDVTTGAELLGGPKQVSASFPGIGDNSSNGRVIFDPAQYKERAALLLLNGVVYTTWASHCDIRPYTGWIIGYNSTTLSQTSVLNLVPNGSGGAIWMADTGPSVDSTGNIYVLAANGDFGTTMNANGFPGNGNFGNAFLKISTSRGLAVADYFEMQNQQSENNSDLDLGSGGALVLPDLSDSSGTVRHLAVGAGKDGHIYVVDRDAMGKFNSSANNIYQELTGVLGNAVFSMPAYFNNTIYYGAVGDTIKAFTIASAKVSTGPGFQSSNSFTYPGATPSISANGRSSAILWAVENTNQAVLHAYDATNLHELYNSNQASGGRDQFGNGNKYITPLVVNGKVYVGTTNSVGVFGLLP